MKNALRTGSMAVAALGIGLCAAVPGTAMETKTSETVEQVVDVAPVWAAHPVGFALLTHKGHQFAAFYDDKRQREAAHRQLP